MSFPEQVAFVANVATIIGLILALLGGVWAGRRFVRQRRYDRMHGLYVLATELFRQGLTIQKRKRENKDWNLDHLVHATNNLKNWFYDNRFLFDDVIHRLVEEVKKEAKNIGDTGCMDKLRALQTELEKRLKRSV